LDTGIPASTVEDILNVFESEQQIRQLKNNKFRLLTVLNWKEYQEVRQAKQQQADSQPTTSRQLADTFKNVKNERIKEKYIPSSSAEYLTTAFLSTLSPEFVEKFNNHSEWQKCFDKLLKEYSEERLFSLIAYFRGDRFWAKNFMSPLKLLKNNKDGIRYADYFFERMKPSGNSPKVDCRTVSADFSSDEEIMRKQREKKNV
jgi:hypothetical protein